jgi:hypothetical protein
MRALIESIGPAVIDALDPASRAAAAAAMDGVIKKALASAGKLDIDPTQEDEPRPGTE